MKHYISVPVFAICAFVAATAQAVDVPFRIRIPGACTLQVTDGTFGVSVSDASVLSSQFGSDAIVRVFANSDRFQVYISDVPDNFDLQPGNILDRDVTFTATYTYLTATRQNSNLPHQVMPGSNNMTVRLVADYNGISYPPGSYRAVVQVTCEDFDPSVNAGQNGRNPPLRLPR